MNNSRSISSWRITWAVLLLTCGLVAENEPAQQNQQINESSQIRQKLAGASGQKAEVYIELAENYYEETKSILAQNPALPDEVFEKLAADSDLELQDFLTQNDGLPDRIRIPLIDRLVREMPPEDRDWVFRDRHIPDWVLAESAVDLDPAVRSRAAYHPQTDQRLLILLAADSSIRVASAARKNLNERSPEIHTQLQSGWTHLDDLPQDLSLEQLFAKAARHEDFDMVEEIVGYYVRKNKPIHRLAAAIFPSLLSEEFDPRVPDLLVEQGFPPSDFARYAGICGDRADWIAYFKAKGAFEGRGGFVALKTALEAKGSSKHISALLTGGVDPDSPDTSNGNQTILHKSVLDGDLETIRLLLEHEANPTARERNGHTPLDFAVMLNFIQAIELMDTERVHSGLINRFNLAFPPVENSSFPGIWDNQEEGFKQFAIHLDPSGSGRIIAAARLITIGWRQTSVSRVELFGLVEGNFDDPHKIGFIESGEEENNIVLVQENGERHTLTRIPF